MSADKSFDGEHQIRCPKLSTESLHEYSNDLNEVQCTPKHFELRHKNHKRSLSDSKYSSKRKNSDENPLCKDESLSTDADLSLYEDTCHALQELDAVLDIHDSVEQNASSPANQSDNVDTDQQNIDICLLDLDEYLDKVEKCTTESCGSSLSAYENEIISSDNVQCTIRRGISHRKTVGGTNRNKDGPALNPYATLPHKKILRKSNSSEEGEYLRNIETLRDQSDVASSINGISSRDKAHSASRNGESQSHHHTEMLTEDQIFQNLMEQHLNHLPDTTTPRPRQYGRRAERYSSTSTACDIATDSCETHLRPVSAPAVVHLARGATVATGDEYEAADGSTERSSRNISPLTVVSSSDSSDTSTASENITNPGSVSEDRTQQLDGPSIAVDISETSQKPGFNTFWPNAYGRTAALISCTIGLFNICRFAVLTINYGGNFIVQFMLLTLVFGIPFFWLQISLGHKIKAGPVSFWKISPICSGIGISLVLLQYFVAVYSSVVIVWILVYIGDVLLHQSHYRWAQMTTTNASAAALNLSTSIPEYLNTNVLQRLTFLGSQDATDARIHISDRLAFYLAILWACVFLVLCKGLRTLGKLSLLLILLPVTALITVVAKLLFAIEPLSLKNIFASSEMNDFLINPQSWTAAAQETFLTWALLGASVIAISSRGVKSSNGNALLRRDAYIVVLVTLFALSMSACLGLCCIQILNRAGYVYVPGSFERAPNYSSVYFLQSSTNVALISYPSKLVPHYSSLVGEIYNRRADVKEISGFQALRFVTELFPAVVAIAGEKFSWIWASVLLIALFVLGLAQLCVLWKPISCALGDSTSSVLLSCMTGLLLSIPFATEIGIYLVHYVDLLVGGSWFVPILWTAQIFGVFLIRGRPYNGDDLVHNLRLSSSSSAFLALSWNVALPIGLVYLAIIQYKVSGASQLYYWRDKSYFPYWARKLGAFTQIGFLLIVPVTALIQIYRYLTSGPPDILDRIQLLYRPIDESDMTCDSFEISRSRIGVRCGQRNAMATQNAGIEGNNDDAPPKYTPPPSYTTATGARLAKVLRLSVRRSVRRLLDSSRRPRPPLQSEVETQDDNASCPPAYASILTSQCAPLRDTTPSISESVEIAYRPDPLAVFGRSFSLGRKRLVQKTRMGTRTDFRPASAPRISHDLCPSRRTLNGVPGPYTAEDVITVLRSSSRRHNHASHFTLSPLRGRVTSCSAENLVLSAQPPGISPAVEEVRANDLYQKNTSVI